MACRYIYQGKEYSAAEFMRVLADMAPEAAAKYMPGVKSLPNAPFVSRTEDWAGLAIKMAIRYAVENSYDRITWDTGATNAERYDLSQQVDSIWASKLADGYYAIRAYKGRGADPVISWRVKEGELEDIVGKDLAKKIIAGEGGTVDKRTSWRTYSGLDLKIGGEGMVGFYDKIMPATVGKLIKKWGGKVVDYRISVSRSKDELAASVYGRGETYRNLPSEGKRRIDSMYLKNSETAHGFDITDAMRESALQGLPMFQRTKDVTKPVVGVPTSNARKTKWELSAYQRHADKLIDAWNHKVGWRWGSMGKLPEQNEYLKSRYRALGNIHEIRETSRAIFDALKRATPDDSAAVYDFMTTKEASPNRIKDEKIRASAVKAKDLIDAQGKRLYAAGLLTDEAMERFQGEYLPRMYLKHVLGDQMYGEMGAGLRLSKQGNLKMRKDIPEEVRKVILGEITDPAFLASFSVSRVGRDLAMIDFLETVSQNKAWVPQKMLVEWRGKKVSPFWLQEEAQRIRRQADYVKEDPTSKRMRDIADRMEKVANTAKESLTDADLTDFKQIPNSPRYGALRGLFVRKEIYDDLVGAQQFIDPGTMEAFFDRTSGRVMRWFKASKVGFNIPSHFRNLYGNAMLLHFSGVPFTKVYSGKAFAQAIQSIRKKDRFYQLGVKYGLHESSFSNVELARISDEWIRMQESEGKHSKVAMIKAMAGVIGDKVGDFYRLNEAIGKIAKIRDAIEREGMSEEDAALAAHEALFDYSLVPPAVRWLRNAPLGAPFLTFTYKVIPVLAKTAIKHPQRYLPYVAISAMMSELLQYFWGGDDDDAEKVMKAAPSWMASRGQMMLMPWKDDYGRMQAFDLGYITPWGMIADVRAQAGNDNYSGVLATTGIFGGPIPDVISAINTNTDPFTKKQIVRDGMTPKEKAAAVFGYAWGLAMPGMFTSGGWAGKVMDYYDGRVNPYTGAELLTEAQVWARLFGLTAYPFDPQESRDRNLRAMQNEIDDIDANLRKNLKDRNLAGKTEKAKEIQGEVQDYLSQKQEEMRKYKEESQVPSQFTRDVTEHKPLSGFPAHLAERVTGGTP